MDVAAMETGSTARGNIVFFWVAEIEESFGVSNLIVYA